MKLKKIISLFVTALMVSTLSTTVLAAEPIATQNNDVKQIEVSLDNVIKSSRTASTSYTEELSRDLAYSKQGQTGTINSIGQYVDFSKVLPKDSKVVSITIYCPTDVKVSQGKFTSINSYIIRSGSDNTTVKFQKTDRPSIENKTTYFAGSPANVKWFIQVQGTVIKQYTGMDGFTIYGGKMIIEYK
jgi:hypothetical protein